MLRRNIGARKRKPAIARRAIFRPHSVYGRQDRIQHITSEISTSDPSFVSTPTGAGISPTFHVLIATVGRPVLKNMINSLKPELIEEDCLTVVYDGRSCPDRSIYEGLRCKLNIVEEPIALGHWGHGIRNKYASLLEPRDFVMHADDDNTYVKGSFSYLRSMITDKNTFYIARMCYLDRSELKVLPKNTIVKVGNIDTGCGIIPYELNKRGTWHPIVGGDGKFYEELDTIQKNEGGKVVFFEKIFYQIRNAVVDTPITKINDIICHATNTNVFIYWDKGESRMPPMIHRIYTHNKAICEKFNLKLHLITDDNIRDYITVPERFWSLAPNFKSDICRFYMLDKHGGIWLDTDIIITKDLNKLIDFLETNKKQMMLDMEFNRKIGCAAIISLPNTQCTNFCRNFVDRILQSKSTLRWEDIGPTNINACVRAYDKNIWINTADITKKGCNFIDWRGNPGINKSSWYYPTSEKALDIATQIFKHPMAYYAVTWTIYRINNMSEPVKQVFDDPCSIFHHLINLANSQ